MLMEPSAPSAAFAFQLADESTAIKSNLISRKAGKTLASASYVKADGSERMTDSQHMLTASLSFIFTPRMWQIYLLLASIHLKHFLLFSLLKLQPKDSQAFLLSCSPQVTAITHFSLLINEAEHGEKGPHRTQRGIKSKSNAFSQPALHHLKPVVITTWSQVHQGRF